MKASGVAEHANIISQQPSITLRYRHTLNLYSQPILPDKFQRYKIHHRMKPEVQMSTGNEDS